MTWVGNIDRAIDDVLKPMKRDIVLHREYMDTKRFFSKRYLESLKKLYQLKYQDKKIDLIFASDNNAFDFLRKYRDELFTQNTPVVFCGVNDFQDSWLKGLKNFTGVAEQIDAKSTLEIALKLKPKTKTLYIVNDYTTTGKAWKITIKEQLSNFKNIDQIYAKNLSIEALQNKIASLPKNAIVLLGVYFKDKNGHYITYEQIGKLLAQKANVPIFSMLRFNVGNGIVGGSVIGGYFQGEAMAKIGKKILLGADPNSIPVMKKGSTKLVFDYLSMKQYNLDPSLLPEGTIILNKPTSFYQKHKVVIWIAFGIIAIMLVVIFTLFNNIKKRKESEALLQLSKEKIEQLNEALQKENIETNNLFKTLLSSIPIPIFYKDKNGIYLGTNEAFDTIYGFERNSLVGKSVYDIAPKELAEHYDEQDQTLFANPNHPQVYESQIINNKTGKLHNVIFHKRCYFSSSKAVEGLIGAIMDITEIKEKESTLQESNKRFHLMFNNIMEGVLIHDTKHFLDINDVGLKIMGYENKEEFLHLDIPSLIIPEDRERLVYSMQFPNPAPYEMTGIKKDGTLIPLLFKPFVLSKKGTQQLRLVAMLDLSDIKAKEKALRDAKEKAESATKIKSQFLANMSHEIRTPMNAVLGMSHLVLQTKLDTKQKEYIVSIKKSAQNLLHIINDILDYSKMEAGKIELDKKHFDISTLVNDVLTTLNFSAQKKGIKLQTTFQKNMPKYCFGDSFRIAQVLLNLLSNAIKFTQEGSVELNISCHQSNKLEFSIQDSGIGIDEEAQQNIFQAFNQADGGITRKFGGTGLGLSISKQLVEIMGGEIQVNSQVGKGSKFSFWIPVKPSQENTQNIENKFLKNTNEKNSEQEKFQADNTTQDAPQLEKTVKEEILRSLHYCAKKRRSKLCKEVLQNVKRYTLLPNDKEFFDTINKLISQRKYETIKEMTNGA